MLLLSALARQFAIHGRQFAQKHPEDWLVWEHGTQTVPRGNAATERTLNDGADVRPLIDDPLCLALPLPAEGVMVRVGRAEGNDLMLSDATVSRHHCTLVHRGGSWMVTAAFEHQVIEVEGARVHFGQWVPLSWGQKLALGHLTLALNTSHGMMMRLAKLVARR